MGGSFGIPFLEKTYTKDTKQHHKVLYLVESNVPYRFEIDYVLYGPPDNFYLTRLHTIDSDSLMIADTLNYKPNKGIVGWVDWIKHYPGEKLIFILERLEHSGFYRKSIVNYGKEIEVNHFYFQGRDYGLASWPKLLKSRKTGMLLNNFLFVREEDNSRHIFKDLEFNRVDGINFEDYYYIDEGGAGTALNQPRHIKAPVFISGDVCDVHIYYDRIINPPYMFSFPCDLQEPNGDIFFRLVNDQYLITRSSSNFGYFDAFNDTAGIGANLMLFDYNNGLIDSFSLEGGLGTRLSYLHNDWVYGSIGYRRPPRSEGGHYHPDYYSPSPGERVYDYNIFSLDSRNFDHGKYGIPFEWREYDQRLYFHGELYSLHLPTMEQTYWETGQGDSEILLLNDVEVIYREHHKIFRAPMVDHKPMIEERELLVMDSLVVPHIHWAFYAEEGAIEKVEVNKDPFESYRKEK
ncbi:MAG: hypothetical protein EA411_09085 [Saprospirales bacterium]|nr:MAG: hypothetical protein EA411_09085 [Saprospirales bacterium]